MRERIVFNEIAEKRGNEKLAEFKKHIGCVDVKRIVKFCLNPRFKTGLKETLSILQRIPKFCSFSKK